SRRRLGSPISLSSAPLADVTFSPRGDLLLVQDVKAENHLVDVHQRASVGNPMLGSDDKPIHYGLNSFSSDGKSMLVPSPSGSTVWSLDPTQWLQDACTLAGRDLTREEWDHYFSAFGPYRSTCSWGPAGGSGATSTLDAYAAGAK